MSEWKIRCEYTRLVPIEDLRPHPKNPKKHSKEAIERQALVMEYQGWRRPITVSNRSGFMTAGHKRLYAAQLRKLTHVPVSFQDYDSEEQEVADLVADNALNEWELTDLATVNALSGDLGPDFDINLLGIKDFTIDVADKHGDEDADAVPEPPKKAKSKTGDLWTLGHHRVLCGDSTKREDVERLMGGEKADMVFTSPPYSNQRDYSGNLELKPSHLAKCLEWPAELLVVNLGIQKKDHEIFPYWNAYLDHANSIGLKLLSWNVWDKMACGSVGHQTAMFPMEHEWIFVWGTPRDLNKTEENKWANTVSTGNSQREKDGSITKREDILVGSHRPIGTVLRMSPHKARNLDFDHPAMFPVSFPEKYIEAVTKPQVIVSDPFLGSGSTLIACEKTNRRCFGSEIDPHYCDVIVQRWEKFTGKTAYLIEDANGELPSGPVSYADLCSMRSKTSKSESKSIVQ